MGKVEGQDVLLVIKGMDISVMRSDFIWILSLIQIDEYN